MSLSVENIKFQNTTTILQELKIVRAAFQDKVTLFQEYQRLD